MPPAPPYQAPHLNARVKKKGITLEMEHTALVRVIVICGFSTSLPTVVIHDALSMFLQILPLSFGLPISLPKFHELERKHYVFFLHYFKPAGVGSVLDAHLLLHGTWGTLAVKPHR